REVSSWRDLCLRTIHRVSSARNLVLEYFRLEQRRQADGGEVDEMRSQPRKNCDPKHAVAGDRRIAVVYQPIVELKPDPKNPRAHRPRQIRQIARSIETFGFNVPVLVDSNLNVIAGHGRILACRQLGLSEVPTIRLEHLTEAQARAFMIADNRLTETSTWDDRLLAEQLHDLSV